MKKVLLSILVLAVMVLGACGKKEKLSEEFDEDVIEAEVLAAVDEFNNRDYQAIIDRGNDVFKESLSIEEWEKTCDPYLNDAGALKRIVRTVISGGKGNDGEDYAIAVVIGKYEGGQIRFTFVYDKEMKLAQFFIK